MPAYYTIFACHAAMLFLYRAADAFIVFAIAPLLRFHRYDATLVAGC